LHSRRPTDNARTRCIVPGRQPKMNYSASLGPVGAFGGRRTFRLLGRIELMTQQFLGATPRRWLEYLAAILIGNAIYYFSLAPHLPGALRHQGFRTDWGAAVDFVVCVAVYGLIRLGSSL
jgi:hypothetical protein